MPKEHRRGMEMRKYGVLLLVLSLLFVLTGCRGRTAAYIDFNQPASKTGYVGESGEESKRPILIALATVLSPNETISWYRQIAEHISRQTGRQAVLVQRKTYAEVNMLLANGDVDIAFLSTGAYSSYMGMNEIELLAMAEHGGNSFYTADIVVHKDSGISSLDDLRGKTFAFTDPLSFSGRMVMVDLLRKRNTAPERFFGRSFYTYSHDRSLWAVANRLADGASLDSQMYEYVKNKNPELADKIRIIASVGPAPTGPIVISKKIREEQKEQFRQVFLHMHEEADTAAAMNKLVIERFVKPRPELYEPLRELYERTGGLR